MATIQEQIDNALQLTGEALLQSDAIGPKKKRIGDTLSNVNSALQAVKVAQRSVIKTAVEEKVIPKTRLAELIGVNAATITKWAE